MGYDFHEGEAYLGSYVPNAWNFRGVNICGFYYIIMDVE